MFQTNLQQFASMTALPLLLKVGFQPSGGRGEIWRNGQPLLASSEKGLSLWLRAFETSVTIPAWVVGLAIGLMFVTAACYLLSKTKRRRQSVERSFVDRTQELQNENRQLANQALEIVGKTQRTEWERLTRLNQDHIGIAHDVNNLLQTVSFNIEFLVESPSNLKQVADSVHAAVFRGRSIAKKLNTLLENHSLASTRCDLNLMLCEMSDLIQAIADENVEVTTEFGMQPLWVSGNALEIQRTLFNLVLLTKKNAKTRLKVQSGQSHFSEFDFSVASIIGGKPKPMNYVWVEVSGDGCSIEAEAKKILQPFLAPKRSSREVGIELGRRRREQREAIPFLESGCFGVSGETNFRIYFPKLELPGSEQLDRTARVEQPVDDRVRKILVVDQDKASNKSLAATLKYFKFQVVVCDNSAMAMDTIKNGPRFDAILVDQAMRGPQGAELVEDLMAIELDTFVYLMSEVGGKMGDTSRQVDRRLQFLQKPFSVKAFAERLQSLEGSIN
jgi:CheY-like chemotaxis protein